MNLLTTVVESFYWVVKKRKVWSSKDDIYFGLKHHHLNLINIYNLGVVLVDIIGTICLQCCIDKSMHNTKGCWSFFTWGLGLAIMNLYVIFVRFMILAPYMVIAK